MAARLTLALIACLAAHPATAAPAPSERGFHDLIAKRLTAYSRGDWASYRQLIDPAFVHISDLGKRRTLAELQQHVASNAGSRASHDVEKVVWHVIGPIAVVDAEVHEHMPDFEAAWQETDLFVVRGGRWTYLHHQETPIPRLPQAVIVVGDQLGDYAGHYRSPAGTDDFITIGGGKLLARGAIDDPPTELIPVAQGTFAVAGDPAIVSFIRDRRGQVIGCVLHLPSGQVTQSRRVE